LPPSLDKTQDFSKGTNFAVVGATGLSLAYFQEQNITSIPAFNSSLSAHALQHLGKSLFVLGADYYRRSSQSCR
jgi:hypothetical protein